MFNRRLLLALFIPAATLLANAAAATGEPPGKAGDDWGPFAGPWVRYNRNPIIRLEDKETYSIQNGPQTVIRWKGKWYMFLMTSQPMVTKLAVSDDGLTWKRPHHNYLLKPDMSWEGTYNLAKAAVIRGEEVWLYYFGKKSGRESIGLARSGDLVHWKKEPKAIFTSDDSRIDGTRAFPDCVIREGGTNNHGRKYSGKNRMAFGLARARHPEGPWEKYPHNPVFKPTGEEKDFDGIYLQHPCPVELDGQWRLYYNGWSLNPKARNAIKAEYAIGLAFTKR